MITKIDLDLEVEIVIIAVVVKRGSIVVKVKDDDAVEATVAVEAEVVVTMMTQGVEAHHHHPLATVDRNHVKIEKERSTRNIIIQKIKRGGIIIRIERRIVRNAREVVVGNTHHEIMRRTIVIVDDRMTNTIVMMMMTRQHLTLPPLFPTMNVRYYNNMNPNVHHPLVLLLPVQPHLANMA